MPSRWLGSDDEWPVHDDDWWNLALLRARMAGWYCMKTAHFCTVQCSLDDPEPCLLDIYSTGTGGESVSKTLVRKVERCRHAAARRAAAAAAPSLRDAHVMLDKADRLLDAAALLIEEGDRDARSEDLLAAAGDAVAGVEQALFDQAAEEELLARDAGKEASKLAIAAAWEDWPPQADGLVEAARQLSNAADEITQEVPEDLARDLQARVSDIRRRIQLMQGG